MPRIFPIAKHPEECKKWIDRPFPDPYLDDDTLDLDKEFTCGNIQLKYNEKMYGRGPIVAPMFIHIIESLDKNRHYKNCLEWCSGPGFIGYSILEKGICSELDLADIWKPSLRAAENVETTKKVTTWHIRKLSDIQPLKKYDLIVGNPPWNSGNLLGANGLHADPGLKIIRQFFCDVKKYLSKDGFIVIVEGQMYTGPKDFVEMIDENGLEMCKLFSCDDEWTWFMVIRHKA